ncbi:MAG: lactate utilization protein [Fimbriimonadaceae bacterium]|nr:lactate utilization protein [Fimbriimonadaceae bacterium]
MSSRVDAFAAGLAPRTAASVRAASSAKVRQRLHALPQTFLDPEAARTYAARVKAAVLDNLKPLLLQFEANLVANGVSVHWARDAQEARDVIVGVCRRTAPEGCTVVKGKSMVTEEIHLNDALERAGFPTLETDLGEYVVQLDGDTPSHIVTPIIHKDRYQVAESFHAEGLGPYTSDPSELTRQARLRLRAAFRTARVGVSGVNFGIASTGRLVIVENEGNNRLSTTAPDVHVAVMGIEKLLPDERDLAVFLPLLAGSATGQQITTYVHMITGPRRGAESDGPREVHVVLLDNGRSSVLASERRDILRCIRCGACLNVCPVYRAASGHGYQNVYCGPVGAVLAPSLSFDTNRDVPFASSLCGACEEVCPVMIPIPDQLVGLRRQATVQGSWGVFAHGATHPAQWRTALALAPWVSGAGAWMSGWAQFRSAPAKHGDFRRWWHGRP